MCSRADARDGQCVLSHKLILFDCQSIHYIFGGTRIYKERHMVSRRCDLREQIPILMYLHARLLLPECIREMVRIACVAHSVAVIRPIAWSHRHLARAFVDFPGFTIPDSSSSRKHLNLFSFHNCRPTRYIVSIDLAETHDAPGPKSCESQHI